MSLSPRDLDHLVDLIGRAGEEDLLAAIARRKEVQTKPMQNGETRVMFRLSVRKPRQIVDSPRRQASPSGVPDRLAELGI